jgi:ATP-dependent helicase/DNAse subunit B
VSIKARFWPTAKAVLTSIFLCRTAPVMTDNDRLSLFETPVHFCHHSTQKVDHQSDFVKEIFNDVRQLVVSFPSMMNGNAIIESPSVSDENHDVKRH